MHSLGVNLWDPVGGSSIVLLSKLSHETRSQNVLAKRQSGRADKGNVVAHQPPPGNYGHLRSSLRGPSLTKPGAYRLPRSGTSTCFTDRED